MKRLIYRDGEWKEVTEQSPRKIYCDSEHCPVADNCFRHVSNVVVDSIENLICEPFDVDTECTDYDPIKEDV
jgi:hypothetical protein